MANQQNIIPFGKLESMLIDIEGVRSTATFEVIEIVDGSNPLEWAFENLSVVNLKKEKNGI